MSEVDKSLLAFLNGLSKRIFFKEAEISDDFLRNEVLGGLPEDGKKLSIYMHMMHRPTLTVS